MAAATDDDGVTRARHGRLTRLGRGAAAAAVVVLVTMTLVPAPALAHDTPLGVRTVVDGVDPAMPGVTVQAQSSVVEQLVVDNRTPSVLEVFDDAGRAFLRIGPGGAEGDLADPSWYRANDPAGVGPVPASVHDGDPPRWARVSASPSWGWFDHRLHPGAVAIPPAASPGATVRLSSWTVPIRFGGASGVIRGHLEYHRPSGTIAARLTGAADPRLSLDLAAGRVPAAFLKVVGSHTVVVLGRDGEPFLRAGPGGSAVNARSPTWASQARLQHKPVPEGADASAEPVWQPLDSRPTLTWLVEQAAYTADEPPAGVVRAGRSAVLGRFQVRLVVDGAPVDVPGVISYRPAAAAATTTKARASSGARWWIVAGFAVVIVVAIAVVRARWGRR